MGGVGSGEHLGSGRLDLLGPAVVDVCGDQQADSGVVVLEVVPGEKPWQKTRASRMEPKWSGKAGRYLRVLNWASEYGLSLDTCGREWLLVTPRSARSWATSLAAIEVPRSAWMASWSRPMPCLARVSAMSRSASAADWWWATIHPTASRLKLSRIVDR